VVEDKQVEDNLAERERHTVVEIVDEDTVVVEKDLLDPSR
jgi:hypothetical protein